ncbi:MAG TPA: sigma-54 dependent transcriptional regulator [Gemmatimonadales bacterium]|nr:sigma-54 dependent transcriptional regulator [Gemmatimonadales bacterium]
MPSILLVDDEANIRRMLGALLRAEGYEVEEAANGNAALLAVERREPDALFLDLMMPPGPDGIATLETLRDRGLGAPVIMMSGKAQLADAMRAARLGAFQFLEKPLTPESVLVTLQAALELSRARAENRALHAALVRRDEMVGDSPGLRAVRELIAQVAPTETRVLITGESGTGKELVAAAIHRASRRAQRPFVPVNSAAIPRELVESEMFGHERGAFTGAHDRRIGRFELADHGTLFLDEVGDLHLEAQAKLLRVLESGEVQHVGAERAIRVDVRVIAATNRRLDQAVAQGQFREDLFFRLNVFPIHLPPLRERLADLPMLAAHFAARIRPRAPLVFTAEAIAALAGYTWPGNIRELANVVERLSILGGNHVGAEDVARVLPGAGRAPPPAAAGASAPEMALTDALDAHERALIAGALARAAGNVAEAARMLQTDRANLYRRMKRLGLGG